MNKFDLFCESDKTKSSLDANFEWSEKARKKTTAQCSVFILEFPEELRSMTDENIMQIRHHIVPRQIHDLRLFLWSDSIQSDSIITHLDTK